jgi:hypothetical protein
MDVLRVVGPESFRYQNVERLSDYFFRGVAEYFFSTLIEERDSVVLVDRYDCIGSNGDDRFEAVGVFSALYADASTPPCELPKKKMQVMHRTQGRASGFYDAARSRTIA